VNVRSEFVAFLAKNEPGLARSFRRVWREVSAALSVEDLARIVELGFVPGHVVERFRRQYAQFVVTDMLSGYNAAVVAGGVAVQAKIDDFTFNPQTFVVASFVESSSANLVNSQTDDTVFGINSILSDRQKRAWKLSGEMIYDRLRASVGLNAQQIEANNRHFERVFENLFNGGMSEERALIRAGEAAVRKAREQRAYRSKMISRTEFARAQNFAADEAVREASAAGLFGPYEPRLMTAKDGRVCKICKALDGKVISELPPLHPLCRCAVEYREFN